MDWLLPHARLGRAALDMAEAVRSGLDAALGATLAGLGYVAHNPAFGFGHIFEQATTRSPDMPEIPCARA
ncbi:hypothetical protein AB0D73_32870 [Streptomyces sp. NPDC048215]|uniref:hypothetical protein n=1 Tax=Streptomyces sp. NPDC048215 TaxID=3156690 RepID=UPI0033BFC977